MCDPWLLPIEFADDWVCPWPRPSTVLVGATLRVECDGTVDFSEWHALVDDGIQHRGSICRRWWALLKSELSDAFTIPLDSLIMVVCKYKKLSSFCSQVLWSTATQFEGNALRIPSSSSCQIRNTDLERLHGDQRSVDYQLSRYIESSQEAFVDAAYLSIATDKASVRGLQLCNSMMVTSANVAAILPPQVDRGTQATDQWAAARGSESLLMCR
jgi:hypothetical protein